MTYANGAGQTSLSEQVAQTSRKTVSACAFASISDGMTERRISTFGLEAPTRFRSRAIDFEHRPGDALRSMETSNTISGVGSGTDPIIVASPTNNVHRVTQLAGESIAVIAKPLFGQRVGKNQSATPNQTGATA